MGRMQEKTSDTWRRYGGDGENCLFGEKLKGNKRSRSRCRTSIILKLTLNKEGMRFTMDSCPLKLEPGVSSCE